jgi:23S rRNA pseudouridine2605 synthase
MTNEDLGQARAQLWRQDGSALLTGEDAQAWLAAIYLCTLRESPRLMSLPSLGAALGGAKEPTRESAKAVDSIATRLMDDRAAALVLWDDVEMLVGEEALTYVFGLAGERELKKAPAGTPLAQEVWKALFDGSKTVNEIARAVGGEVTAGAVRRALQELWRVLRVLPLAPGMSEDVRWELAARGWPQLVRAGVTMSQVTALSALVTIYLHCAVAATEEEVERVLAPLASRTRVQEVLRGLHSARQIEMVGVGHASYYALTESAAVELAAAADDRERAELAAARAAAGVAKEAARAAGPRKEWKPRERFAGAGRSGAGRPPRDGERKPWVKREGAAGGERKPWVKREGGAARPFVKRGPPRDGEQKPWVKREGAGARPFVKREGSAGGERKPWVKREGGAAGGERKPWVKREGGVGGERKPYVKREGGAARPFVKRGPPRDGERKPWVKREGAGRERKPYVKREGGSARPFVKRGPPRDGERKPWVKREGAGGERKPYVKREGGSARPFVKRGPPRDGERKPWVKREGGAAGGERRPWKDRPTGKAGERPGGAERPKRAGGFAKAGERKPWVKREGAGGERKPFRKSGPVSGRSFAGKSAGKPGADRGDYKPRPKGAGGFKRGAGAGAKPWAKKSGTFKRPNGKARAGEKPPARKPRKKPEE